MESKKVSYKDKLLALWLGVKWTYKASKFLTIIVIFTTIFGGLIGIIEPYIFKLIIDNLIEGKAIALGDKLVIGLVGIFIIYGLTRILQNIFWDISSLIKRAHSIRMERYAMHEMMKNISSLDLVYFEDPKYYNTVHTASSNLWRVAEVFWSLTFFVSEIVSVLVILGALLAYDWRIVGLILLGAIPGMILAAKASEIIWSAFTFNSPIFRHASYYRSLLTEKPEAIKEIRSFGLQAHFLKKFKNLFTNFIKEQDKAAIKQLFYYLIQSISEGVLSVFAAWLVVQQFMEGSYSIGDLTFLWAILFQFASHSRYLVRMSVDLFTHANFISSIVELMNFEPTIKEPEKAVPFPKKLKKGIEFRNVTFFYPRAKKPALKNVNFLIKPGDNIALVGENGSGKTTLIKLLCRLYDVTKGEILIDEINIKEYSLKDLYDNIGIIFQDFMKYEALVEENISFGRVDKKSRKKVKEAATKSGANEFIKDLDKAYKTQLGKKITEEGVELSVGQWQKIALARAFYRDARLLILDEPTSAVDARAEYNLFKKFKKLTKSKTTILISHRFSTVRIADRIIVIDKAKVIEQGSHKQLLKKKGVYANLFSLQAKGYK